MQMAEMHNKKVNKKLSEPIPTEAVHPVLS